MSSLKAFKKTKGRLWRAANSGFIISFIMAFPKLLWPNNALKGTRLSEALFELLGYIFTTSGLPAYWPARPLAYTLGISAIPSYGMSSLKGTL